MVSVNKQLEIVLSERDIFTLKNLLKRMRDGWHLTTRENDFICRTLAAIEED